MNNLQIQEKMYIKYLDKKRILFKSKLEETEIAYSSNAAKKCYHENSIRQGFKPETSLIVDKEGNIKQQRKSSARWCDYYEKQFELQDGTDSDSKEEWTLCVQTAEPYVELPNGVDIEMAISKPKSGKATGHDQILVELMKVGGKEFKKVIY
jgi:hypothetical protein